MNQQEFHEFAAAACRRAVARPGSIGYLRLTQFYRESACEHRIREPEMRQALIQEAEARCFPYSVEMPTDQAYRFTPLPGDGAAERPARLRTGARG